MQNRAIAVLYAKSVATVQAFYESAVGLEVDYAESDHVVLASQGLQLVILRVPEAIAATITLTDPPRRRTETPIKLIFEVESLARTRALAPKHGGELYAPAAEWTYRGYRICDGTDPEGNVIQCREKA
jgi:predicted enzyme related to lactoylglutathione lyase